MILREFHSTLRVLATLNMQDLVDAGAIDQSDDAAWNAFKADPLLWILCADERCSVGLWRAMERRASALPLPPFTIERQAAVAHADIVQFFPRKGRSGPR